ncbi:hypothetical protein L345_11176, partial [Ophiophagus hannah]
MLEEATLCPVEMAPDPGDRPVRKPDHWYLGPFPVEAVINPVTYHLKLLATGPSGVPSLPSGSRTAGPVRSANLTLPRQHHMMKTIMISSGMELPNQ